MNNVKALRVLKLITGETVVAEVEHIELTPNIVILHNPLQPMIQRKKKEEGSDSLEESGIQFALVPLDTVMFLAKEGEQQILVSKTAIVWETDVKHFHKIEEAYHNLAGAK